MLRMMNARPDNSTRLTVSAPYSTNFGFTLTGSGSVSVTKKLGELLDQLSQPPFPDCTSIELLSAFVRDPNGNVFAVPGMKIK